MFFSGDLVEIQTEKQNKRKQYCVLAPYISHEAYFKISFILWISDVAHLASGVAGQLVLWTQTQMDGCFSIACTLLTFCIWCGKRNQFTYFTSHNLQYT